jgi:hypothetical protein
MEIYVTSNGTRALADVSRRNKRPLPMPVTCHHVACHFTHPRGSLSFYHVLNSIVPDTREKKVTWGLGCAATRVSWRKREREEGSGEQLLMMSSDD